MRGRRRREREGGGGGKREKAAGGRRGGRKGKGEHFLEMCECGKGCFAEGMFSYGSTGL